VLRPGQYFVEGDNRLYSCDSREFGPVEQKSFIGKVIAIIWPASRVHV
jgi:type IV secretory pathway protease TraF